MSLYLKYENERAFSELVGKTLASIEKVDADHELIFTLMDGTKYIMLHKQDCCESVTLDDVEGDFADLIGSPITLAEVSTSDENPVGVPVPDYRDDSFTWTFYRIATAKGFVTLRWYGASNGYYSESVDFGLATSDRW